jgi:hypothetical protein
MNLKKVAMILFVMVCVVTVSSSAFAQTMPGDTNGGGQAKPTSEPLSKKRLLKLLTLNDSSEAELVQIVGQKGVEFQPTPADERELHDAGASDALIVAVRANYRGDAGQSNAQPSQVANAGAGVQFAQAQLQVGPQTGSAPVAPAPKKKSGLAKFNEKLTLVNAALAQVGTTQAAVINQVVPALPQPVAPAASTAVAGPADPQVTAAQPAPQTNGTTAPIQTGPKKSFLDRMNQGLNKANDRLAKATATLTPIAAQTIAQPAPAVPPAPATVGSGIPTNLPVEMNTQVAQAPAAAAPTQGAAPANLVGTYWNLTSMTTKGEAEKDTGAPGPDVEFCKDGKWGMLHYGGAREAGTYQVQGDHLIMKMPNGSLYGDFQITRNGNEMTLDNGKYVLRLKYQHQGSC